MTAAPFVLAAAAESLPTGQHRTGLPTGAPGVTAALFVLAAVAGACLRVVAGDRLNRELPFGTFAVNVVASFAVGALSRMDPPWPTVAGVGALGALSTWSALANEVAELARADQAGLAWLYLAATISCGILAAWIGLQVAA